MVVADTLGEDKFRVEKLEVVMVDKVGVDMIMEGAE